MLKSAIAATVALTLLVSACGGPSPKPAETVTYWSVGHNPGTQVLELVKRAGGYYVAWNGGRPHAPLAHHGNVLVLTTGRTFDAGNRSSASLPEIELIRQGAKLILAEGAPGLGPTMDRAALVSLSHHAYLGALASYREEDVREWTGLLSYVIRTWAKEHGSYPQPADLQPGSPFGRLMAKQMLRGFSRQMKKTQPTWPINPFTAEPMESGTQPGDFTYRLRGSGYVLSGHLGGGRAYTVRSP